MPSPVPALTGGLFVRYVDSSNYMRVSMIYTSGTAVVLRAVVVKRIAGTETTIGTVTTTATSGALDLTAVAYASGQWVVKLTDGSQVWEGSGSDAVLATGGTLASGRFGLFDYQPNATASTRTYDTFQAWVPPADAAMFASQSLTIHHDKVRREDSGGTLSVKPSSYEGDYLLVPPTGPDSRTNRFIVKASRNVPGEGADAGTDDISARLTVTPRFLVVPS